MIADANKTIERLQGACADQGIEVPVWVPGDLIVDFCDCALTHGEEVAAGYVRRLKAERLSSNMGRLVGRS